MNRMSFVEILGIAVSLAMDAFAVSLGAGTHPSVRGPRPSFRLSFHFGLFQFLMPVLGWIVGLGAAWLIGTFAHWVAFALLAFVGGRMIYGAMTAGKDASRKDPSRGLTLIVLSVATSIDSLAVGLTFAMMGINIWYPSVVIGIVTGALCLFGVQLGTRLGARFGQRMEIIGGTMLLLIGVHFIWSELHGG
jgi:putative Mn2+ efflux pump MntP